MAKRLVQVGSYYIYADYENGQYTVSTSPEAGPHRQAFSRNPRSLLNIVADEHLFISREAAEAYWRTLHATEPVWDVYERAPEGSELLPLSEAAAELGRDHAMLRNQIHNRRLQAYKLGRNWVVTRDELERYRRENLDNVGRPRTEGS